MSVWFFTSENGFTQLRSLKRERSVRPSVPSAPPDLQVWLCSYTKSGNALAFESRLVVRKHTCTLGSRPAPDLATQRPPPHLSAKNNQNTHRHYCLIIDIVLIWTSLWGQKAQFKCWPLIFEYLTSQTWAGPQKPWCHSDAHEPASWTTFLSFTQSLTLWRYQRFLAPIFCCGGAGGV